jgi:hypothetical protein
VGWFTAVLTSVVLALGLGVLTAAGSLSIVYFGLLTALAVTAALLRTCCCHPHCWEDEGHDDLAPHRSLPPR